MLKLKVIHVSERGTRNISSALHNRCQYGKVAALKYNQYCDVIMGAMVSQPHDCLLNSGTKKEKHQRKHQSSASLAFMRGIHRGPGQMN